MKFRFIEFDSIEALYVNDPSIMLFYSDEILIFQNETQVCRNS